VTSADRTTSGAALGAGMPQQHLPQPGAPLPRLHQIQDPAVRQLIDAAGHQRADHGGVGARYLGHTGHPAAVGMHEIDDRPRVRRDAVAVDLQPRRAEMHRCSSPDVPRRCPAQPPLGPRSGPARAPLGP